MDGRSWQGPSKGPVLADPGVSSASDFPEQPPSAATASEQASPRAYRASHVELQFMATTSTPDLQASMTNQEAHFRFGASRRLGERLAPAPATTRRRRPVLPPQRS